MSFHEVNKTANSKYCSGKQIGSFKDAGNGNSISSVSCKTSINVDNNRKLSTKDIPTQRKNGNKSVAVYQEPNVLKNDNQFPQAMQRLSILVDKAIKMNNTLKMQRENPIYSTSVMRENIDNKTARTSSFQSVESIAPVDKGKLSLDAAVRNITCSSFIDSSVNENPFNKFGKFIRSTKTAEGVLSFAPEASPPQPIILKKRRICRGVLSVNDCTSPSRETDYVNDASHEKNTESEYEDNGGRYSGKEYQKSSYAHDDSTFVGDGNERCPPTPEANQSVLLINEPIRMKCIDEATKHTRVLVVYSDEYLTNRLQETGSMVSEEEVFKDLLNHCVDYNGKTLRMITDAETFFCNLGDNSKSQGDIRLKSSMKVTKQIPQRASGKEIQKEDVTRAGNSTNKESPNKGKQTFIQRVFKQKKLEMNVVKSSKPKRHQIIKGHPPPPVICKQPKDSCVKRNDENSDTESVKRLTSALNKINVERIISSEFKHHFSFYAKFKSRLKSGYAISKNNNNFWLKTCGIISDDSGEKIADECFHAIAGVKCILNIKDYLQYITTLARKLRLIPTDIVHQLMSTDTNSLRRLTVN